LSTMLQKGIRRKGKNQKWHNQRLEGHQSLMNSKD